MDGGDEAEVDDDPDDKPDHIEEEKGHTAEAQGGRVGDAFRKLALFVGAPLNTLDFAVIADATVGLFRSCPDYSLTRFAFSGNDVGDNDFKISTLMTQIKRRFSL